MTQPPRSLVLGLDRPPIPEGDLGALRDGLSSVVQTGRHLWLVCDETPTLERLTWTGDRFAEHRTFPLGELIDLPGGEEEADLEGLAWAPPYLWIVGSHSRKRGKPDPESDDAERQIERLATVKSEDNRYLLARIPLEPDAETGALMPRRRALGAGAGRDEAAAARLRGDGRDGALMEALRKDEHLSRFLKIPGKDNGFDVEGVAVAGERVFLGLRGPVLRGWAVVLEVEPVPDDEEEERLRLRRIGPDRQRYRKHFLHLDGLGVRDLVPQGDDLLILAGATMDVVAPAAIYRWRGALNAEGETLAGPPAVERLLELPANRGEHGAYDHPEGMALLHGEDIPPSVLVVYDAAAKSRRLPDGGVRADVFALPG